MKAQAHILAARAAHHKALETLNPGKPGLDTWRKLARIERDVSAVSVAWCNGECTEDQWEEIKTIATSRAAKVFGGSCPSGFFINSDPRGYALKIDPDKALIPDGMHRDLGGYGILAPTID